MMLTCTISSIHTNYIGKSTILQIVMSFYEISAGSATVDGKEFSEMNVNNLRRQIGYVGQMPTLFNMTGLNVGSGLPRCLFSASTQALK